MDFELTDEQRLLGEVTRQLLERGYDTEVRNRVSETELGWSRQVWAQLAEIGVLGLGLDPAEAGAVEILVVQNEIGRFVALEPVIHAALVPGGLIAEAGNQQQRALLGDIAAGQTLLAFAHIEPGMRAPSDSMATQAVLDGDTWVLHGSKNPVSAASSANHLVVSAALPEGGAGLFLVVAVATTCRPYRTLDGQRAAHIDLNAATAEPLGAGGDASDQISRTVMRYQSALCAEAVGCMDEALRLTTDYLTTRKQFGVTLNNFQTLTQRAADMYVSLELARSMSLYAAISIANASFDPLIALSTTPLVAPTITFERL